LIRRASRRAGFLCRTRGRSSEVDISKKKQGATGITTIAPYVAGQWGRGE
jgi:hypothetical protein